LPRVSPCVRGTNRNAAFLQVALDNCLSDERKRSFTDKIEKEIKKISENN
jgi:hypothetical protein